MSFKRVSPETRKRQIIAAADLVLLEVGIDCFTVDQVIERARIAKGTVYNHYKNKDEMLIELGFQVLILMQGYVEQEINKYNHSIDKIKGICKAYHRFYEQYPAYFELISYIERPEFDLTIQNFIKIKQYFQKFINNIILKGQEKGEIKNTLKPSLANHIIWITNIAMIQFIESKKELLKQGCKIEGEEMFQMFIEMMAKGIGI